MRNYRRTFLRWISWNLSFHRRIRIFLILLALFIFSFLHDLSRSMNGIPLLKHRLVDHQKLMKVVRQATVKENLEHDLSDLGSDSPHTAERVIIPIIGGKQTNEFFTGFKAKSFPRNCSFRNHRFFPLCTEKMDWLRKNWNTSHCYANIYKIDGSNCSLLHYLTKIEPFCIGEKESYKAVNRPTATFR